MNHRLDQIICWFFAHFVANIGANLKIDSSVGAKKQKKNNTHIHSTWTASHSLISTVLIHNNGCIQRKKYNIDRSIRRFGKGNGHSIYHKSNAKTLILSNRNSETLEAVQDLCNEINNSTASLRPIKIHILKCDLSNAESVDKFATESLRLCGNQVDVLVNNGGISSRSSFVDTTSEVDEFLMRVNFLSGAALTKRILPVMVSNNGDGGGDGRIIWISSIQGLIGTPFRTSYAASKFAVQGYCEALRSELTSSGVSVHVVSPGYIRTNLSLSAVCGDGSKYGNTYATTAKGADPDKVAVQILDSVAKGCQDFVVAASPSSRIALWIKIFSPPLLRKLLVKRFKKNLASRQ